MMLRWYCKAQAWWIQEEGSSMVEWMVLGVLIVVGLFATIGGLRDALKAQYCILIKTIHPASTACS